MSETIADNAPSPISGLVATIHVADIDRAAAFYRLLGFEIGNFVPREGPMHWAWLYAPGVPDWRRGPNLMLTRNARPINADGADVLFYLYAADLPALRNHLLAAGISASEIKFPEYLPNGEFRVQDPDGYIVMIAQSMPDTP
jgi:catechol 2,3-dioxygenase-like lactoylglutathione lyase family enzyme